MAKVKLKFVSLTVVFFQLFSATATGSNAILSILHSAVVGSTPLNPYGETPPTVEVGSYPIREPASRGGMWNQAGIDQLNYAADIEANIIAPPNPPTYYPNGLGDTGDNQTLADRPDPIPRDIPTSDPENGGLPPAPVTFEEPPGSNTPSRPGPSYPWEGSAPGGGSQLAPGIVNTQTGNRLTTRPIISWPVRGDIELDFTMYHNSQDNQDIGWGKNWRSSYDLRFVYTGVNTATNSDSIAVTYPNGKRITFTRKLPGSGRPETNRFFPPRGRFDVVVLLPNNRYMLRTPEQTVFESSAQTQQEHHGYLAQVRDRYGNFVNINRSFDPALPHPRITSITDTFGRQLVFTWNSSGDVIDITAPGNNLYTLNKTSHFGNKVLSSFQMPDLGTGTRLSHSFTYTAPNSRAITSETDLNGAVYSFTYSTEATKLRFISFTNPTDVWSSYTSAQNTFTYTYYNTKTSLSLPTGGTQEWNYDAGYLKSIRDPGGYSVAFWYDNYGLVTQYRSQKAGDNSYFGWNKLGNLLWSQTARQFAASKKSEYTWNTNNDILSVQDSRGAITSFVRESGPQGKLQQIRDGLNNPTASFVIDSTGQLTWMEADGNQTSITWQAGMPQTISIPGASYTITSSSFAIGQPAVITDNRIPTRITTLNYDNWGRLFRIHRSMDGNDCRISMDPMGNVTDTTDWLDRSTTYQYDNSNRLRKQIDAVGNVVTVDYDQRDLVKWVKNARNYYTHYTYTNRGELAKVAQWDGWDVQYQ